MQEDGHLRQVWLRAQTATEFGATHHGHHPVCDDQVRQAFPYRFQRLGMALFYSPHLIRCGLFYCSFRRKNIQYRWIFRRWRIISCSADFLGRW